jgi:hypothetical protein
MTPLATAHFAHNSRQIGLISIGFFTGFDIPVERRVA